MRCFLKNLTRRELLFDVFTKDTLKSVFGAYNEFNKAKAEANKMASCDDAARILGKKAQEHSKKFFQNIRKEG